MLERETLLIQGDCDATDHPIRPLSQDRADLGQRDEAAIARERSRLEITGSLGTAAPFFRLISSL
jgi:hypothetical protein